MESTVPNFTPKAPINDWIWRTLKENGTVNVPLSTYFAQKLDTRHDLEVEEYIEDAGEGVVVLVAHRDYKHELEGHPSAVDTARETLSS